MQEINMRYILVYHMLAWDTSIIKQGWQKAIYHARRGRTGLLGRDTRPGYRAETQARDAVPRYGAETQGQVSGSRYRTETWHQYWIDIVAPFWVFWLLEPYFRVTGLIMSWSATTHCHLVAKSGTIRKSVVSKSKGLVSRLTVLLFSRPRMSSFNTDI